MSKFCKARKKKEKEKKKNYLSFPEEKRVDNFIKEIRQYSLPAEVVNGLKMMDSNKSITSVSETFIAGLSSSAARLSVTKISANSPTTQTPA